MKIVLFLAFISFKMFASAAADSVMPESKQYNFLKRDRAYVLKWMNMLLGETVGVRITSIEDHPFEEHIILNKEFKLTYAQAKRFGMNAWKIGKTFSIKVHRLEHEVGSDSIIINDKVQVPYAEVVAMILVVKSERKD